MNKKTKIQSESEQSKNAVLYISRVPYGFDDNAAWEFFKQFGEIKGVCFPRSKKSGRSKGYMFILFEDRDVAMECAKSVDNYYLFRKSVKCVVLPQNHKIIYNKFKKNPKKFKFTPWKLLFKKAFNSSKGDYRIKKVKNLLHKDDKKVQRFAEKGLSFKFVTYRDLVERS